MKGLENTFDLLKKLGYDASNLLSGKDEPWKSPTGELRRLHCQICNNNNCNGSGEGRIVARFWFGIPIKKFVAVDDFVFCMAGQECLLIVPSDILKSIFEANGSKSKEENGQWHVNIEFTNYSDMGEPWVFLHPTWCEKEDISKYAKTPKASRS